MECHGLITSGVVLWLLCTSVLGASYQLVVVHQQMDNGTQHQVSPIPPSSALYL
jgi:hypothetical protein